MEMVSAERRRLEIEINVERCRRNVILSGIEMGRWLLRAKEENVVPHGEWTAWVEAHAQINERSAQRLMQIAREIPEGSQLEPLGKTKVEALLALPSGEREEFATAIDAEHSTSREVEAAVKEWKEKNDRQKKIISSQSETIDDLRKSIRIDRSRAFQDGNEAGRRELGAQLDLIEEKYRALDAKYQKLKRETADAVDPAEVENLRRRLNEAQDEADRLADQLDAEKKKNAREKLGDDNSTTDRILSAVAQLSAMCGRIPGEIAADPLKIKSGDVDLILSRVNMVGVWVDQMRVALGVVE